MHFAGMHKHSEGRCANMNLVDPLQVAAEGKMCIMPLDAKRASALSVPGALKIFLAPGGGLAQAVRAGLPPTTKEPQVQQAIQAATAEAEKAKVSPCVHFLAVSQGVSPP